MNDTLKNYVSGDIIVESKMNTLSLWQVEYLYETSEEAPLLPEGVYYRAKEEIYVVQKRLNKEKIYVGCSKDINVALHLLFTFCKKHRLKI